MYMYIKLKIDCKLYVQTCTMLQHRNVTFYVKVSNDVYMSRYSVHVARVRIIIQTVRALTITDCERRSSI